MMPVLPACSPPSACLSRQWMCSMPTHFSALPPSLSPALANALSLGKGSMITIIGSGGKTTLMHSLARGYAAQLTVLCTTTTKLWEPLPEESPFCLLPTLPRVQDFTAGPLTRCFPNNAGMCTIASAYAQQSASAATGNRHPQAVLPDGTTRKKIVGYTPEALDEWWSTGPESIPLAGILLVEADGSAGRPLKAHSPKEPLIPGTTQVVIGVVGLWGLGQPLHEDTVWRPDVFAQRSGLCLGAPVTPETLARVITHPQGLFSRSPAKAQNILFLNGAETPAGLALAQTVANAIKRAPSTPVHTVVAGSAHNLQGEHLCLLLQ